jgi:hypothetical protein
VHIFAELLLGTAGAVGGWGGCLVQPARLTDITKIIPAANNNIVFLFINILAFSSNDLNV